MAGWGWVAWRAMEHVVVVGASLAGLRACETLRAEGFTVDRNIESERDAIEWVKAAVERFTES